MILAVGLVLANVVWRIVLLAAVNAGWPSARLVGGAVYFLMVTIAAAMALDHVGLARPIVLTAFALVVGAVMLALAIAIGVGSGPLVRRLLEERLAGAPARSRTAPPTCERRPGSRSVAKPIPVGGAADSSSPGQTRLLGMTRSWPTGRTPSAPTSGSTCASGGPSPWPSGRRPGEASVWPGCERTADGLPSPVAASLLGRCRALGRFRLAARRALLRHRRHRGRERGLARLLGDLGRHG